MTVPTTGPRKRSPSCLRARAQDIDELVAVDQVAALVDHDDAVAVAVERDADMRSHASDRELQQIGARASRSRR